MPYPDDDSSRKWQQQMAEQKAAAQKEKHPADVAPAVLAVEKMNFSYTVKGGDEHIRPLRVFDDGANATSMRWIAWNPQRADSRTGGVARTIPSSAPPISG